MRCAVTGNNKTFALSMESSWKEIELKSENENDRKKFLYKFYFNDQRFVFKISDLKTSWKQELNNEEILKKCKQLNPRLNAPLVAILDQINASLASEPCTKITNENFSILTLKSTYKSVPFNWAFNLIAADSCELLNDVIIPLYATISNLVAEREELLEVIKRKDNEINDYKENGAKVSRTYLETDQFVPATFNAQWRKSYSYASTITKSTFALACDERINEVMNETMNDCLNDEVIEKAKNGNEKSPQKIAAKLSPQKPKKAVKRFKRTQPVGANIESDSGSDHESVITKKVVVNETSTAKKQKRNTKRKGIF